jgi:hypothetical protein
MKNVHFRERRPVMRITMPGAPPLAGWAIRLLQDIPECNSKNGYWMDHWTELPVEGQVDFGFEPDLHMAFAKEAEARHISDFLRTNSDIATEAVKIGNPQ